MKLANITQFDVVFRKSAVVALLAASTIVQFPEVIDQLENVYPAF